MPNSDQAVTCSQCQKSIEPGSKAYVVHEVVTPTEPTEPVKVLDAVGGLICQECWH